MKACKVSSWADDEAKFTRLLAAVDAMEESLKGETVNFARKKFKGRQTFDLAKVTKMFEAFGLVKDWSGLGGSYIPRRLWRSYCLVHGKDLPDVDWFGMDHMSQHEKEAIARLGPYGKTPKGLATALERLHDVEVGCNFSLLVAICEMGSLVGSKPKQGKKPTGHAGDVKSALAAVQSVVLGPLTPREWKAKDLVRFGDKVNPEWTYHR